MQDKSWGKITDAFIHLRSEMCTGTMCAELGSTFEQSYIISL